MTVTVPIWLAIPGFMPLRVFAKKRAEDRRQFYGKHIIAVDNNGEQASAFMANQARSVSDCSVISYGSFLNPFFVLELTFSLSFRFFPWFCIVAISFSCAERYPNDPH